MYSNNQINKNTKYSFENGDLKNVLQDLIAQTDLQFEIKNKYIVVSKATPSSRPQQNEKTIKGTVVDQSGIPIIGANVIVKGTSNGTVTDIDGNFSMRIPEGANLLVSYIGYINIDLPTQGKSTFSIVLKEDSQALDEVVVVGYGVQKKANLTGSVSSLDGEKISLRPVTNATQSLQGLVPGLTVTNSNSGRPGASGSQLTKWLKLKSNAKFMHSTDETPFGEGGLSEGFYHSLARFRPTVSELHPTGM